jgi:hypothetical protein
VAAADQNTPEPAHSFGRIGSRYVELSWSQDTEALGQSIGHPIRSGIDLNFALTRYIDGTARYSYNYFSDPHSSYSNSITGGLTIHRKYGSFDPYVAASATRTRSISQSLGGEAAFDYGSYAFRTGVEYAPNARFVVNVSGGVFDFFAVQDKLLLDDQILTGNISATVWILGPLGMTASWTLAEEGETATVVGAVATVRF